MVSGIGTVFATIIRLETNPQDLLALNDQVGMLAPGAVKPGAYESLMINLQEEQSR
jgi:hypothetical protein